MNRINEISINGVAHQTVIVDGVQRFRCNPIIRKLLDVATTSGYSLNEIWIAVGGTEAPNDDIRELYRLIGYSVCGYADIFPDDDIDNPMWNRDVLAGVKREGET